MIEVSDIISYVAPILTACVSWVFGRHLQRLDYADKQSDTIGKLQAQNAELLTEIEKLQDKIVELTSKVSEYRTQLTQLQETFDLYILESNKRLAQAEQNGIDVNKD